MRKYIVVRRAWGDDQIVNTDSSAETILHGTPEAVIEALREEADIQGDETAENFEEFRIFVVTEELNYIPPTDKGQLVTKEK